VKIMLDHAKTKEERALVLAPLAVEAIAVGRGQRFRVVKTGMGAKKSRRAARRLEDEPATTVVVVGVCGALDPTLEPGAVFVADEVRGEGAAVACAADEVASALESAGLSVARGTLVSTDHVVTGAEREALRETGARAVDMESAYLSSLAEGRRFAVVRVVVDTPSRELRHALHTAVAGARALRILGRIGRVLDQL
jgi:4-hydroxy-3-methylbut-2-enyl diphosphate reductase